MRHERLAYPYPWIVFKNTVDIIADKVEPQGISLYTSFSQPPSGGSGELSQGTYSTRILLVADSSRANYARKIEETRRIIDKRSRSLDAEINGWVKLDQSNNPYEDAGLVFDFQNNEVYMNRYSWSV